MAVRKTQIMYENKEVQVTVFQGVFNETCWVAIKEQFHQSLESANLAIREAMIQSRLDHPNICTVYDCYLDPQEQTRVKSVIVMELLSTDLLVEINTRLAQGLLFTETEVWTHLRALISALSYAQKRGVSHGDIKPQNLFLSWDKSQIKIGDFGSSLQNLAITPVAESVRGTPAFLSPELRKKFALVMCEQQESTQYDPIKSDVFSLGVTTLFMILHRMPRELCGIASISQAVERIVSDLQVGERLKQMLRLMLAEDPANRPSFSELETLASEERKKAEIPTVTDTHCVQCDKLMSGKPEVSLRKCGHSFHHHCFSAYIQQPGESKISFLFVCPVCRSEFDPREEISQEEVSKLITEMQNKCESCESQCFDVQERKCGHSICPDCESLKCKACVRAFLIENGFDCEDTTD